MAQPSTRQGLIDYCKRRLGAPVLEVNVADEQIDDLVDDALQYFHERHFDGVTQTFLKYKVTQADIDRGRGRGGSNPVGIVTTTADATIVGTATTFSYEENSNYLQIPPHVIGISKIFHFDGANTTTNNMFSVKYQMFLNDIYYWGSTEMLTYAMTKTYLEDLDFFSILISKLDSIKDKTDFISTSTGVQLLKDILLSLIAIERLILMIFQEFITILS